MRVDTKTGNENAPNQGVRQMGKKIKYNDKSITIRLPIALYDKLAECATLGDYRSVSQYVRDMIHASVLRLEQQSSCE